MKGRFSWTMVAMLLSIMILCLPSSTYAPTVKGSGPGDQRTISPWPMAGGDYSHNRTTDLVYDEDLGFELEWIVNVSDYRTPEFVVSSDGTVYLADYSTGLVAVSPEGHVVWRFCPPGKAFMTCPTLGPDGTIYFTAQTDHLFAIHPNGTERWNLSVDSGIASGTIPVVMQDGTVFLGVGGYKLFCIRPNGTVNWSLDVKGCIYTPPAIDGQDRLIFNTAKGTIYCVTQEGVVVWERSMGVYSHATTSLTRVGEAIIRLDNGSLLCLHPNGTTKWLLDLGINDLEERMAISDNGDIYLVTSDHVGGGVNDRFLLGLHQNGTIFMRETLTDYFGTPLVMGDGRLLLPGNDLYILGDGSHLITIGKGEYPTIKTIAPVNGNELRALSRDGRIISFRMRSISRPTNLTAEQVDDHVHLEWVRPQIVDGGALDYIVIRESIEEGETLEIGWTDMTEFDDRSIQPGRSFLYYVQAVMGNETSPFSDKVQVTHCNYIRPIQVKSVFLACHYQEDIDAVAVEFKEDRYAGVVYIDDEVGSVDVLRGSSETEPDVVMVMYPSGSSVNDIHEGTISHLSGGSGVYYDLDLEPGMTYYYRIVYHYESGVTIKSDEEGVRVPDVEGPNSLGNFMEVSWEVIVIAMLFNVAVIVALVAFLFRKLKTKE